MKTIQWVVCGIDAARTKIEGDVSVACVEKNGGSDAGMARECDSVVENEDDGKKKGRT